MKSHVRMALAGVALLACRASQEADAPSERELAPDASEARGERWDASAQPMEAGPTGEADAGNQAQEVYMDAALPPLRDGGAPEAAPSALDAGIGSANDGSAPVPPGKVPVFVAIGHMGRSVVSCDDGRSWSHDRSLDDAARCFENGLDCDHHPGAGRGLAFGSDSFVAAFGWGEPGQLKQSRDGATWRVVKDKAIFAGVAFGHGVFVANATRPLVSPDGVSWHDAKSELGLKVWNTRGVDWFAPGGGRFLVTGESETTDLVQSKDDGETWAHVGTPPPECGAFTRGAAHNATTVVLASGKGWVCTSSDGGESWELVRLGADGLTAPVLWTGTEFMTWNRSDVYRSQDGKVWTKQQVVPANLSIGPVARGPHGTFVASNDGWLVWYEKQQFLRSMDGVHWEVLDKTKFKGGHPITFMRFGYADAASSPCP